VNAGVEREPLGLRQASAVLQCGQHTGLPIAHRYGPVSGSATSLH
jgi:hypothetical protein